MLGLFGTLNLGARSLATQQQGIEVAGHNLANVNNPAYARQRVDIATSPSVKSDLGSQGTGAEVTGIVRLRSDLLDQQIQSEITVRASLEAQQSALQYAQANLGQKLDNASAAATAGAVAGESHSLSDDLVDLFNSFQSLSNDPASLVERQNVLGKAAKLAAQFHQIDQRLAQVNGALNQSVQDDTATANALLAEIASLNNQVARAEVGAPGTANDLRDLRQSKIEELSKYVKIDLAAGSHGAVNISIAGTLMVSGNQQNEQLEAYDAGGGQLAVRAFGTGAPLALSGGQLHGTIDARDGAIADLRGQVNTLAATLIQEVNTVHAAGFSLTGSTGVSFFTGTNASDIQVNAALANDPSLLQAAGAPGATGDNRVALALAQLASQPQAGLGNQTFSQSYSRASTAFGQSVSSVDNQLADQQAVEQMLLQRRNSISGVSMDEEMTDLTRYQRAFQASAKLITTIDELLSTVVNMKQ